MRKRIFAAFVCLCMMMALVPSMAYANDTVYTGGLCEHHTQHDGACGYTEGTAEIPCSHEHNESCGGLTDPTACNHTHDEACGYVPATAGTPCTYVCEVCNPQDSGNPATPSDAQPEECTCETLCTEEEINGDCPVCSVEGAELDKVCVGAAPMLPVTALAAGNDRPHSLYVGNTNFASTIYPDNAAYWTSSDGGTNWTSQLEKPTGDSYIHYNGQGTLTLHNANIQGQYDSSNRYSGYGIYAVGAPGNAVSLTIKLEGTNTVSGWSGIFVHAVDGAASLSISGTGSLATEGTGGISFSGIVVQGNGGKAELTINNVDVTATNTSDSAQGILLQSADSSPATLTVNGGELTASGQRAGIKYVFGSSGTGDGTPTVTVSGNAIVRANGGISDDSSTDIQIGADSNESNGGIVFDGKNGTVYGAVTLQEDLEIGEGESLTLDDGASLNAGNHNVIVDGGTLDESIANSLGDSVKYAPTIVTPPADKSVTEGETATFTVNATGTEPLSYQWQQSTDNGSSWTDITGETNATYTIATTTTDMSGTQYHCVVKNSIGEVTSNAATLTVNAIPTYTITVKNDGHGTASATPPSAKAGEKITLTATPNSGYRFAGWTSSDNITFANAGSAQTTFTMPDRNVTVTANWKKKSSGGGSVFFWDLKFDTNGGSKIDTVTEWEYSTIDLDEYVPEKEGYKFVGWYADKDLTKKIDEVYLTQDTTVYAKWEKIEEEVPEEPDETEEIKETETISFKDVKENDWFYEAVSYAVENGLMSGMSEDIFAPNTPLTREMLAVVLYNVEGQPEGTEANTFTDVKGDMWYTEAILWANANGIVAGYDNGAYGVGDLITREQFATILYRYAQFKGYDTTQGGMAVREFSDYENISDYARPAMAWAVNAGIMGGMDDGTLMPQGKATRAEAANMLMNFCENIVK
ncbi:putative uncharacterized protein [Firmicutes bacterium CAG:466]|nr:putative uncharacterized protein [Firmicutes bacterium CAG:466]